MYGLYSAVLTIALAFILPAYFVRLRLKKGESLHLRERLGLRLPVPSGGKPFLWVHAVSVGEVLSLPSLLKDLRRAHPDWEIGFSALTNTGRAVAEEKLRGLVDHIFFVPFDLGGPVRRAFKRLDPSLLVLAESEFWPRILREAGRRNCPVLVVNGRVSARSYRRFLRFRPIARRILGPVTRFLVQTPRDRERLERIGVAVERIEVSGNLKCETRLPVLGAGDLAAFRADLGIPAGKKVVVAGSIHLGEEGTVLEAFREARKRRDDVLLVLAPRHPDKFADLEKDFPAGGLVLGRRTRPEPGRSWDVLLLDTIGELAKVYAVSEAAFIGGSLIPWGGQNLLEPAFYGRPVVFGPHMENFAALVEDFVGGGGARVVRTSVELAEVFSLSDPEGLVEMGRRAKAILVSLQGASERTLAAIAGLMEKPLG